MQNWTNEQIAQAVEIVVQLMRRVRDDMHTEIDAQLKAQKAFDGAMVEMIEKQAAVLAWSKCAYAALCESTQYTNIGVDVRDSAPAEVRNA